MPSVLLRSRNVGTQALARMVEISQQLTYQQGKALFGAFLTGHVNKFSTSTSFGSFTTHMGPPLANGGLPAAGMWRRRRTLGGRPLVAQSDMVWHLALQRESSSAAQDRCARDAALSGTRGLVWCGAHPG